MWWDMETDVRPVEERDLRLDEIDLRSLDLQQPWLPIPAHSSCNSSNLARRVVHSLLFQIPHNAALNSYRLCRAGLALTRHRPFYNTPAFPKPPAKPHASSPPSPSLPPIPSSLAPAGTETARALLTPLDDQAPYTDIPATVDTEPEVGARIVLGSLRGFEDGSISSLGSSLCGESLA